jgi:hypothetical protein
LLLEGLVLLIPCAQLGGWLIEGKADWEGDGGCDHEEKEQALPPDIATTFFVAEFVQMGERFGRFGALVVGIVDDEATTGQAIVA